MVTLNINGKPVEVDADPSTPLLWALRDNLGLIKDAPEIEKLAEQVDDNGGCFVVPAFSGLFAPHWKADARGAIVGITRGTTRAHLARATLEAIAF